MYVLNCAGVIPGCSRVIRAESEADLIRKAVVQAKQLGVEKISPSMLDTFRRTLTEDDLPLHAA